jgi:hypothetical protein
MFTSLVFYLYDWKVERRQNRVVVTARRSSALLSSLFPATVRDQLYQTHIDENKVKEHKWSLPVPFKGSDPSNEDVTNKNDPSPIAQLYNDTTIIFMDIVGFTHWSSTRQPTAVFQLLETIYGKFDSIAKVHGVFKIETIGDSYVAVVGLPMKRKRHAVIMARFANACLTEMKGVVMELEEALGEVRLLSIYKLYWYWYYPYLPMFVASLAPRGPLDTGLFDFGILGYSRFNRQNWPQFWSYHGGCVTRRESSISIIW